MLPPLPPWLAWEQSTSCCSETDWKFPVATHHDMLRFNAINAFACLSASEFVLNWHRTVANLLGPSGRQTSMPQRSCLRRNAGNQIQFSNIMHNKCKTLLCCSSIKMAPCFDPYSFGLLKFAFLLNFILLANLHETIFLGFFRFWKIFLATF